MAAEGDSRERELELAADYQRAYADALLSGRPRAAEVVIGDAIEAGLAEATIDDHVIRPALRTVGDLWADGRIGVGEEHLATSITMRVLALQREAFRMARQRVTQRVLLAGAEGELHVVGLEMAASVLLHAGYDVRLLGADLPVAEVRRVVELHDPAVVGFTAALPETAGRLPDAIAEARDAAPEAGVLLGGRAIDGGWGQRLGVAVCEHVSDAVGQVDALVRRAAHN